MRVRAKIVALSALSLMVAGSAALLVNIVAFEHAPFPTWRSYSDALLQELEVSREGVIRAVSEDPDILFGTPGDTESWNGVTIDEASQAVQERAIERTVERTRVFTAVAIAAVMLGALVAGWLLARRILVPIRQMTERARAATGIAPGDGLALAGPNDEIKELADTLDEMLDRISRSYAAQRLFAAQVAHELRTPLATTCSEIDMLLAGVDDPVIEKRLHTIADATGRSNRLVGQLLVLSRAQTGDLDRGCFALDDLVGNVLGRAVEAPEWREILLDFDLRPTSVLGDRPLLESLVRNLIENAGRHNRPDGRVCVVVRPTDDGNNAMLEVQNSTADMDPSRPRDDAQRPQTGLSIVGAVVDAHAGVMHWERSADGVAVRVILPAPSAGLHSGAPSVDPATPTVVTSSIGS